MVKYIFITGGVLSGLGKGITASSTGMILKNCGHKVTHIKIDPYYNHDAGTMSPYEHGEVFVLEDGGEVDLDLGNYERFTGIKLTKDHNITTGKINELVSIKERRGDYLGKTVQIMPHVTNEIKAWIKRLSATVDICIVEIGGTVGDYESIPFLESARQMQAELKGDVYIIHLTYIPVVGEQKTKPTQHSYRELMRLGITPDMMVCRSDKALTEPVKNKIKKFCPTEVICMPNVNHIYEVPIKLARQMYHIKILNGLNMKTIGTDTILHNWITLYNKVKLIEDVCNIVIVGKYIGLKDAYHSIIEAIEHACYYLNKRPRITWIDAETEIAKLYRIKGEFGVIVPGGFGSRGAEEKIKALRWCRRNGVPCLGICLGMQLMVVEFCRNVLDLAGANSTEMDKKTPFPVCISMKDYESDKKGGTMRLGNFITTIIKPESKIGQLYGANCINERHRHRYEINPKMIDSMNNNGLDVVGVNDWRVEIVELRDHQYYVGTQFHPEFNSSVFKPSAPFVGLIGAIEKTKDLIKFDF